MAVYPHVVDELAPGAWHCRQAYANRIEAAAEAASATDARPENGQSARIIIAGHAFIQNIRRGHYELGVAEPMTLPVMDTFDELALVI